MPRDCENLAQQVQLPVPRQGQDMRIIALNNRKAAVLANNQLAATRECQAALRGQYEAAK